MKSVNKIIVMSLFWMAATPLFGEIQSLNIGVNGLSCPFCVYGLEKQLTQVKAIESVEVNLKAANADISLHPGIQLDIEAIREAVVNSGFTIRDINIQVKGTLYQKDDAWFLKSDNDATIFVLTSQNKIIINGSLHKRLLVAQQRNTTVVISGKAHSHGVNTPGISVEQLKERN